MEVVSLEVGLGGCVGVLWPQLGMGSCRQTTTWGSCAPAGAAPGRVAAQQDRPDT